jgi:DNA-binding winged helix-turn-helix (wHTH) protein
MVTNRSSKQLYEFGSFLVDLEERRLVHDGHSVALTPKAYDTLLVLVENCGRVVDKEELMKRVWPDAFVEEGGLTRNISVLRKVLRDSSPEEYIQTIPRRGYRFVAPVRKRVETTPYLKWVNSQGGLETFSLTADEVLIGRKADADVVLADPYVSRRHARIVKSDQGHKIIDLESSHGTFLNGTRIDEQELQSGDRISLGKDRVELVYFSEEGEQQARLTSRKNRARKTNHEEHEERGRE